MYLQKFVQGKLILLQRTTQNASLCRTVVPQPPQELLQGLAAFGLLPFAHQEQEVSAVGGEDEYDGAASDGEDSSDSSSSSDSDSDSDSD
jgi:hypothetical protein